jgi:small subunit ribosomal protein S17
MTEETENNEAAGEAVEDTAPETRADASVSDAEAPSPAAQAEPVEVVAPKERRARARASKAAKRPARAAQSPEERQAARVEARAQKAAARRREREQARAKHKEQAHERSATPPREHVVGQQKTRQGVVVSDKADKTITVRIDVARRHRRYQKIVRTSSTLHAHDEQGEAHVGDTVIVRECRPLSRTKRWRLVQVLERAE